MRVYGDMTLRTSVAAAALRAIAVEYGWVDYLPKERTVLKVDPAVLAPYVGDYQFPGGPLVNVQVKHGRLIAGVGSDVVELFAEALDSFFDMDGQSPPVMFVEKDDGSIALHADGGVASRKQPQPAAPPFPDRP
jgi:hypothetical protein